MYLQNVACLFSFGLWVHLAASLYHRMPFNNQMHKTHLFSLNLDRKRSRTKEIKRITCVKITEVPSVCGVSLFPRDKSILGSRSATHNTTQDTIVSFWNVEMVIFIDVLLQSDRGASVAASVTRTCLPHPHKNSLLISGVLP